MKRVALVSLQATPPHLGPRVHVPALSSSPAVRHILGTLRRAERRISFVHQDLPQLATIYTRCLSSLHFLISISPKSTFSHTFFLRTHPRQQNQYGSTPPTPTSLSRLPSYSIGSKDSHSALSAQESRREKWS